MPRAVLQRRSVLQKLWLLPSLQRVRREGDGSECASPVPRGDGFGSSAWLGGGGGRDAECQHLRLRVKFSVLLHPRERVERSQQEDERIYERLHSEQDAHSRRCYPWKCLERRKRLEIGCVMVKEASGLRAPFADHHQLRARLLRGGQKEVDRCAGGDCRVFQRQGLQHDDVDQRAEGADCAERPPVPPELLGRVLLSCAFDDWRPARRQFQPPLRWPSLQRGALQRRLGSGDKGLVGSGSGPTEDDRSGGGQDDGRRQVDPGEVFLVGGIGELAQ
mmetsp:Transcript_39958/g.95355  ORF Transcript_39958/g.95355 Transcript_39958/m.95355 type:complete len:276 (-) Transcript_39958:2699-3526(-)